MVVLITGCRSGFGLLAAVEAGKRGHTVYASLRDLSTADEKLTPMTEGLDVRPIQLDVTVPEQRQAVVDQILVEEGRIDALVNNAGIATGGCLEQLEEDEVRKLFEVNVFAPWALTKLCLPSMREREQGTVVMVSSMSGRMSWPALGAYGSTKHALTGMSEAWRYELLPFGINLALVEPGPYKTDIFERNRQVGRRVHDADSPYAPIVKRVDDAAKRISGAGGDPQVVADQIVDIIEAKRTRLRYPMSASARARVALFKVLPQWALDRVFGLVFKR